MLMVPKVIDESKISDNEAPVNRIGLPDRLHRLSISVGKAMHGF